MAAESQATRDALEEEHRRNASELAAMIANAQSNINNDISDEPAGEAREMISSLKAELAH